MAMVIGYKCIRSKNVEELSKQVEEQLKKSDKEEWWELTQQPLIIFQQKDKRAILSTIYYIREMVKKRK